MKTRLWLGVLICLVLLGPQRAIAQTPSPTLIKYGDVIADKFTPNHTHLEYQFEAEEGDGVALNVFQTFNLEPNDDGSIPSSSLFSYDFYVALYNKDGNIVDEDVISNLRPISDPNWAQPAVFGLLATEIYTITVEVSQPMEGMEVGFVLWLHRAPPIALDSPVRSRTSLTTIEQLPNSIEDSFYTLSVEMGGYFDLSFQLSTAATEASIYIYDTKQDHAIASTTFDFSGASEGIFAGVMTYPLVANHLYAVILSTYQYTADGYDSLIYEIELSPTPADRLPHSD